jgi:hypothetical protein
MLPDAAGGEARVSLALERYTSAPSQPFALMFLGKIPFTACRP